MADVLDVADYLLLLAGREPEPEPVTNLRLQKLLYYVQGWSFGYLGRGLFDEPLKAWPHGPVVARAYEAFKHAKAAPLTSSRKAKDLHLSHAERDLIEGVWSAYKQYSASALREMTHRERPWLDARRHLPEDSSKSTPISIDAMFAHFSSERADADRDPVHRARSARIAESRRQIAHGECMTLDEVIAKGHA
jgi:uncharacterized phage-associated protein